MRMRGILALTATLLLGACASAGSYEQTVNSWVGQDRETLVAAWGPPTRTWVTDSGENVVEYVDRRQSAVGRYISYAPGGNLFGGSPGHSNEFDVYANLSRPPRAKYNLNTVELVCVTRFVVDDNDAIRSSELAGNHCAPR